MQKTISMSELTRHAERIAKDIERSNSLYRVKRPGGRGIVLMDWEYYQSWMAAIELMQRPSWREEWSRTERDLANGKARPLEDVVQELGLDRVARTTRRGAARQRARGGRREAARRTSQSRRRSV